MAYSKEFLDEMTKAQDLFVWEAPAWELVERSPTWYVWMGLAAFALVAYAVYTSNYLFAFVVLLITIILVLAGNENPRRILFQIGEHGIVVGGRMTPFAEIHDFAIVFQPPEVKVLYVQPKSWMRPRLRIPLEQENPLAIRAHLKRYVAEDLDLRDEHISDIMGRLLRL